MSDDRLTAADVAARIGVNPATFRAYVARGQAPAPDGQIDGRTPYWDPATIDEWRPYRTKI